MDRMTNDKINERQFILAVCLIIFGCILLLSGFIVSPTGVIHGSVLAAFGEICTMVGAILGINYASHKKIEKIKEDLYDEITKGEESNENSDRQRPRD